MVFAVFFVSLRYETKENIFFAVSAMAVPPSAGTDGKSADVQTIYYSGRTAADADITTVARRSRVHICRYAVGVRPFRREDVHSLPERTAVQHRRLCRSGRYGKSFRLSQAVADGL